MCGISVLVWGTTRAAVASRISSTCSSLYACAQCQSHAWWYARRGMSAVAWGSTGAHEGVVGVLHAMAGRVAGAYTSPKIGPGHLPDSRACLAAPLLHPPPAHATWPPVPSLGPCSLAQARTLSISRSYALVGT